MYISCSFRNLLNAHSHVLRLQIRRKLFIFNSSLYFVCPLSVVNMMPFDSLGYEIKNNTPSSNYTKSLNHLCSIFCLRSLWKLEKWGNFFDKCFNITTFLVELQTVLTIWIMIWYSERLNSFWDNKILFFFMFFHWRTWEHLSDININFKPMRRTDLFIKKCIFLTFWQTEHSNRLDDCYKYANKPPLYLTTIFVNQKWSWG